MSQYSEFFLNSKSSVVQLELIEIRQPNFSKSYNLVRNAPNGIMILRNGIYVEYEYLPLRISLSNEQNDLDQNIKVMVGDLGDIIPKELERIKKIEGGYFTKPSLVYLTARSDTLEVIHGPVNLEVKNITFDCNNSTLEAQIPCANINKTGEVYALDRFPMLRGLL